MRKFPALALAIAALSVASCTTASDPVTPTGASLVGFWQMTALDPDSNIVELGITSDSAGALTGCVLLDFFPENHPYDRYIAPVGGALEGDSVWIRTPTEYAYEWSFGGHWAAADTIRGNASLDGAPSYQATLARGEGAPSCANYN